MTINSSLGVKIEKPKKLRNLFEYFFGEDQSRYVLEIDPKNIIEVEKILKNGNIYFEKIGFTQKNFFEIEAEMKMSINELFEINNQWYNSY